MRQASAGLISKIRTFCDANILARGSVSVRMGMMGLEDWIMVVLGQ